MTILLDTSVIIDALNHKHSRHKLLLQLAQDGCTLACCAVNMGEVYAGMRREEQRVTAQFFQGLECIEIGCEVAERAGTLKYEWARKGRTIDLLDLLIAAVALMYNLTLATDNRKDFPMMADVQFLDLPSSANQ